MLDVEAVVTQAALDVACAPLERVLDDFMFRLQMHSARLAIMRIPRYPSATPT